MASEAEPLATAGDFSKYVARRSGMTVEVIMPPPGTIAGARGWRAIPKKRAK
jgi:hypothetical protein